MNREAIYSAIWALAPTAQFVTSGRKLVAYDALKAAQYPALFQTQQDEVVIGKGNLPGVLKGSVNWWLYVYADSSTGKVPTQTMNPLLDAIQQALVPDSPTGALTLGGLVTQCHIDGTIKTDEGYLQDYSVAIIPIVFTTGG